MRAICELARRDELGLIATGSEQTSSSTTAELQDASRTSVLTVSQDIIHPLADKSGNWVLRGSSSLGRVLQRYRQHAVRPLSFTRCYVKQDS